MFLQHLQFLPNLSCALYLYLGLEACTLTEGLLHSKCQIIYKNNKNKRKHQYIILKFKFEMFILKDHIKIKLSGIKRCTV